jgi:methylmalonyl-CoA/ethylmalonyl-CoA epimerase
MQHHNPWPGPGSNRPSRHDGATIDDDVDRPRFHVRHASDCIPATRRDMQHADDLPRARTFYERLLNTQPAGLFDPPGLLFFRSGSVRLLLEQAATSALIYFKVDDVRATLESLRADGVEIVAEPQLIFSHADDSLGPAGMDEWMAFVKDSEGNTIGLVSHHKPEHS